MLDEVYRLSYPSATVDHAHFFDERIRPMLDDTTTVPSYWKRSVQIATVEEKLRIRVLEAGKDNGLPTWDVSSILRTLTEVSMREHFNYRVIWHASEHCVDVMFDTPK